MKRYFSSLLNELKLCLLTEPEKEFLRHNKKIWKRQKKSGHGEIIVEAITIASSIISLSYFLNTLGEMKKSEITFYFPITDYGHFEWFRKRKLRKIFRSFNGNKFISNICAPKEDEVTKIADSIIKSVKSKRDVEIIEIESIWVGDIIYDTHLKKHRLSLILQN